MLPASGRRTLPGPRLRVIPTMLSSVLLDIRAACAAGAAQSEAIAATVAARLTDERVMALLSSRAAAAPSGTARPDWKRKSSDAHAGQRRSRTFPLPHVADV